MSFGYQNNSRGIEYGQGNGETYFNQRFEPAKVCAEIVPKNMSGDQKLARK
jgi:hypothetical protein